MIYLNILHAINENHGNLKRNYFSFYFLLIRIRELYRPYRNKTYTINRRHSVRRTDCDVAKRIDLHAGFSYDDLAMRATLPMDLPPYERIMWARANTGQRTPYCDLVLTFDSRLYYRLVQRGEREVQCGLYLFLLRPILF